MSTRKHCAVRVWDDILWGGMTDGEGGGGEK